MHSQRCILVPEKVFTIQDEMWKEGGQICKKYGHVCSVYEALMGTLDLQ